MAASLLTLASLGLPTRAANAIAFHEFVARGGRAAAPSARRAVVCASNAPVAAAQPDPSLAPEDVVRLCMEALARNDFPECNSGLATCYAFSNDMCRAAVGGSLEEFVKFARNPIFGSMVNHNSWRADPINLVGGGTPTRGAMATQLVHVISANGQPRTFIWTLQQERRPPNAGAWLVWQCLARDKAIELTI